MSLRIVFTPNAWEDYDGWLRRDVKMVRRISKLILDVQRDPHGTGLGKPELLKGPLSGWSSRRINDEHRLIYRVRGGDLETPPATATTSTSSSGSPQHPA